MSVVRQLGKRLVPLVGCMSFSAGIGIVPLTALYGNSTSQDALLYLTEDKVVPLAQLPKLKKLSFEERKEKIEKLKTRLKGFSHVDTKRIQETLEDLLSIQDHSMREVLDNLPDNLTIELGFETDREGAYLQRLNHIVVTKECLKKDCVWLGGTLGHEFFHTKQAAMGYLSIAPIYMNTKTFVTFFLIAEAEARSFEQHIKMRLMLKGNEKIDYDEILKIKPISELQRYAVTYYKALYALEQHYPTMDVSSKKAEAQLIARGEYMKHLLSNQNSQWSNGYLERVKSQLQKRFGLFESLPVQENNQLSRYVWKYLEKTYGLTKHTLDNSLDKILRTPQGQKIMAFKNKENSWTGSLRNSYSYFLMSQKKNKEQIRDAAINMNYDPPQERMTSLSWQMWKTKTR